jgi:hypothetical protein
MSPPLPSGRRARRVTLNRPFSFSTQHRPSPPSRSRPLFRGGDDRASERRRPWLGPRRALRRRRPSDRYARPSHPLPAVRNRTPGALPAPGPTPTICYLCSDLTMHFTYFDFWQKNYRVYMCTPTSGSAPARDHILFVPLPGII